MINRFPRASRAGIARFLLSALVVFCFAIDARAYEAYSFLKKDCSVDSGFVINLDDDRIRLLTFEGRFRELPLDQVDSVFVFNFVENPIRAIHADPGLEKDLRAIYLEEEDEPSVYGWPVRFIDSLVMFYDVRGKTHVYDLYAITKIRPARLSDVQLGAIPDGKTPSLNLENGSVRCPHLPSGGPGAARPTRIVADEIKVRQFLKDYEKGFRTLEGYQERTYLYAKPFLYEKLPRMGLIYFPDGYERDVSIPLYFQWSTGQPYRFQSFTVLGRAPNEFAPNAEPLTQFRSDLKAHIFHAHFTGNLAGFAAGTEIYGKMGIDNLESYKTRPAVESQVSLNYLALMGGDFGPFTASVGYFFPVIVVRNGTTWREVLASRVNYAVRGMYTKKNWRVRAIFSPIHYDSDAPTDKEINRPFGSPLPSRFDFRGLFFRAGADAQFSSLRTSLDVTWNQGKYEETEPTQGAKQGQDFDHITLGLTLHQQFEETVALVGFANMTLIKDQSTFGGTSAAENSQIMKYGGAIEFFF